MINTDFPTTYAKNYILDVVYSINYASKVGRIAKPFADTKFFPLLTCNLLNTTGSPR